MKKNMGNIDRVIRLTVAVLLVVLVSTGVVSGVWGTVVWVAAGVLALVSAVGFCPLYKLLGMSTCKTAPRK